MPKAIVAFEKLSVLFLSPNTAFRIHGEMVLPPTPEVEVSMMMRHSITYQTK
jgi:hypothetical protein